MMLRIQKHVSAVIDFEVDLVNNLESGETLSAPAVIPETASGGVVSDVSITNIQIVGTAVKFRVTGGKAHDQVAPHRWETVYCLKVTASTSTTEKEGEPVLLTTHDCQQQM